MRFAVLVNAIIFNPTRDKIRAFASVELFIQRDYSSPAEDTNFRYFPNNDIYKNSLLTFFKYYIQ